MNSKVLIVEDDGIFATALKKKLENWGYVPKIVFTGQDALNEMEVVDPDLIIMDIYLKGKLNGINTAELIDDKFEMPIIYYSSSDDEKLSKSLKNHRNRDYVSKSSSDEHLKKTIENNLKKNNNIHNQDLSYVKKEKIDQKGKNSENLRLKINSNPPKAEYINEISLKPEIKIKKDFDSISKIKKMK
ncbi:MAG TPA: response regulator, partial [Methanobacteriaceae archaeon]|nr:response regulator [Methanobacteriaceae archaeon]